MIAVTFKNLWARKRQLVSTFVAVFLGVAFLTGTLALNDTFRATFDKLFGDTTAGTDAIVQSGTTVGRATRALIPASTLSVVRAVPGVADAQPTIEGYAQLLGRDGKALGGRAPRDAGNWITDPALNPYHLVEGRAPTADDEVVINRGAATSGHLHLGQTTIVQTPTPIRVTIVGIAKFGDVDGFGPGTYTSFTLAAASRYLTSNPARVSSVVVRAAPGVSQATLVSRLSHVLPSGTRAVSGTQLSKDNLSDTAGQFLTFLRIFMLVFAGIALVVAAFSIANTFSILVAQRTRETAVLRALGASRRQVLLATAAEAGTIGVVASLAGLAGGVGVAAGLKAMLNGFGFAVPANGLVVHPSTVLVALLVGVGVTLAAAWLPARRASRTAPLAAIRDAAIDRGSAPLARMIAGGVGVLAGVALVIGAVSGSGEGVLPLAGLGALVTIIGVVTLGPIVARPASAVLGKVLGRGITGQLGRQNAMRNPRRTAATASALLVGVTVVTMFTVFGASLRHSINRDVDGSFRGDLAVSAGADYGGARMDPRIESDLAALPSVATVAGIAKADARIGGGTRQITVVDPAAFSSLLDVHVVSGALSDNRLAVAQTTAKDKGWHVGTVLTVTYPDGATGTLTVGATYRSTAVAGDYLVPRAPWAPHDPQPTDATVLVRFAPRTDRAAATAAVAAAARPYGAPRVQGRGAYEKQVGSMINTILGLVYAMLALSVIIALMGISNTLSLATFERTRELGLLRAIGQTRGQLRSMVRYESMIVALFGTVGGIAIGVFLGWALADAARNARGIAAFTLPTGQLVTVLIAGVIAGAIAAVRPARRAARLDVLAAVASA